MGHAISAALIRDRYDAQQAAAFRLSPIELPQGLILFPLHPLYYDHWSEQLKIDGFISERPLLNGPVVHHIVRGVAGPVRFAIIETDYFGGKGDQAAVVYEADTVVLPPSVGPLGPINRALHLLGIESSATSDEFDAVGLGRYRDFDDLFQEYLNL